MTNHGIAAEQISAADAAAWSLISLLLFCVLCFAIGAWVLWRREKRRPRTHLPERGEPFDKTSPDNANDTSQEETRDPWERDENWWQKPPSG